MLYARRGRLAEWKQTVIGTWPAAGLQLLQCLDTSALDGYEPFGFQDGISQPQIDWSMERQAESSDQLTYSNLVAVGEFMLGYLNGMAQYTARPLRWILG
jgi:hypothetical protein